MSEDHQTVIGLDALKHVDHKNVLGFKNTTNFQNLRAEVLSSKSTAFLNREGEVERVVAVLAYKITRQDARHLMQIGEVINDKVVPSFKLPGGKTQKGELPGETAHRLLTTKLAPLANHIEVENFAREVVKKLSKEFGVQTKYLRTEVEATLVGDLEESEYGLWVHYEYPDEEVLSHGDPPEVAPNTRPHYRRRNTFEVNVLNQIQSDGHVFTVGGKTAIYAWLDHSEVQALNGPEGEKVSKWLAMLSPREVPFTTVCF